MSRSRSFLSQPISSYYLLLVSAASLTVLGLVMVLSASSIHSLETSGSSFAARQSVGDDNGSRRCRDPLLES